MNDSRIDELLTIADRISRGEIPEYQHNECYTSGAFDLLIVNVHEAEAYTLLSELCQRYTEVKERGCGLKGYLTLLLSLAVNSQTTELPMGLREIIADNPALSHDLGRWYRLSV
jgi:hypothetical protein